MEQQSLFDRAGASPLAARMRPQTLDEFVGPDAPAWAPARCCAA